MLVPRPSRRTFVAVRIDSLCIDRLDLIEQIWDNLPEQVEPQDIPHWHVAELATSRCRTAESPGVGKPYREGLGPSRVVLEYAGAGKLDRCLSFRISLAGRC